MTPSGRSRPTARMARRRPGPVTLSSTRAGLAARATRPAEHVAVFEAAHRELRDASLTRQPRTRLSRPAPDAVPRRLRLDAELVRRGLARSREHASELIAAGRVTVAGAIATKPATGVTTDVALVVLEDPDRPDYVSRGGHKLAGALAVFEPAGSGGRGTALPRRRRLDRRVHRRPAARRARPRWWRSTSATASSPGRCSRTSGCVVHDRTNIRELTLELVGGPVDLVVGDLSFISLELVLDALLGVTRAGRRPRADGQAAVRGGQGPGRQGRRRPRPGLRAEAVTAVAARRRRDGAGAPGR